MPYTKLNKYTFVLLYYHRNNKYVLQRDEYLSFDGLQNKRIDSTVIESIFVEVKVIFCKEQMRCNADMRVTAKCSSHARQVDHLFLRLCNAHRIRVPHVKVYKPMCIENICKECKKKEIKR